MTNKNGSATVNIDTLTKAQLNFLAYCKELGYGRVEVVIQDGQPVMVEQRVKLIKLTP